MKIFRLFPLISSNISKTVNDKNSFSANRSELILDSDEGKNAKCSQQEKLFHVDAAVAPAVVAGEEHIRGIASKRLI